METYWIIVGVLAIITAFVFSVYINNRYPARPGKKRIVKDKMWSFIVYLVGMLVVFLGIVLEPLIRQ